jgi:hypothetical protein
MRTTIAAAIALACVPAHAGDAFTMAQCRDIGIGLSELNGYSVVVGKGDASSAVQQQYKLRKARFTVAMNMTALKPVNEAESIARNALINEISNGTGIVKPDTPEAAEYQRRYKAEVLDKPCPVTFGRLSMKDLNPGDYDEKDKNPIPPYVLSLLDPIIDHDEK